MFTLAFSEWQATRAGYDLLKVILLTKEYCNINFKPCLSVTFILLFVEIFQILKLHSE